MNLEQWFLAISVIFTAAMLTVSGLLVPFCGAGNTVTCLSSKTCRERVLVKCECIPDDTPANLREDRIYLCIYFEYIYEILPVCCDSNFAFSKRSRIMSALSDTRDRPKSFSSLEEKIKQVPVELNSDNEFRENEHNIARERHEDDKSLLKRVLEAVKCYVSWT